MTHPTLSGVVLAGGASSRMGQDKALLVYAGEPLVARAARLLASFCDDVVLASGDGQRLGLLELPQVADVAPGLGPLAGIVAGLERAAHPLVAVLAVDMPYASGPLFGLLAQLWAGEPAVVPVVAEALEPLHAVYAREAASALRAALAGGQRSVRRAVAALGVRRVGPAEWAAVEPAGRFAGNLNRPGDLGPEAGHPDTLRRQVPPAAS